MSSPKFGLDPEVQELELREPPLPQTLLKAVELMDLPEGPEIEQVIQAVQHDPVVVARLLRIVNSAYFGQRGQVKSVQRAVVVLGPDPALGIVMSMGLAEMRASMDETTAGPFLNLVRHSIATAFLAQYIVAHDPRYAGSSFQAREPMAEAFTAGLLHDFGKIVLLYSFPQKAVRLYDMKSGPNVSDQDMLAIEHDYFGWNHVEAGLSLMQRLNLPAELTQVIACHHREDDYFCGSTTRPMIHVVRATNRAVNAFDYSFNRPTTWEHVSADPLWDALLQQGILGYDDVGHLLRTVRDAQPALAGYVDALV